jgi:hypothetical protein
VARVGAAKILSMERSSGVCLDAETPAEIDGVLH